MAAKNAGLRIRVERDLRDEFLKACRAQDRPAAQVIREFMRGYVAEQKEASVSAVRSDRDNDKDTKRTHARAP